MLLTSASHSPKKGLIVNDNIIATQPNISKLRPNLWQANDGAVIGFGAILSPTGLYFCFTCNGPECPHTQTVNAEWLAGRDSAEEMIFASSAGMWPDDYGLQEPTL